MQTARIYRQLGVKKIVIGVNVVANRVVAT